MHNETESQSKRVGLNLEQYKCKEWQASRNEDHCHDTVVMYAPQVINQVDHNGFVGNWLIDVLVSHGFEVPSLFFVAKAQIHSLLDSFDLDIFCIFIVREINYICAFFEFINRHEIFFRSECLGIHIFGEGFAGSPGALNDFALNNCGLVKA